MDKEEEVRLREVLAGIPVLKDYRGPIERLGGLTNKVYRVGGLVLRIPGEGTSEYINRDHEAVSAQVAADAGVAPEVLYVNAETGVMVTRLIDHAVTMTPENFRQRSGSPARAGAALRKLHVSGGVFPFRFELFAMIDEYLAVLVTKHVALPEGYHDVVAQAQVIRVALARHAVPLVPCHCDPLCENFIDDGAAMWIVDWEYSGMNDPMWDLGDLSVEGAFDKVQDDALLRGYFGGEASAADQARMVIYKAMCDLLWTLWGMIQHANNNPADDFHAYALNRFNRCKELMATDAFERHVAVLGSE